MTNIIIFMILLFIAVIIELPIIIIVIIKNKEKKRKQKENEEKIYKNNYEYIGQLSEGKKNQSQNNINNLEMPTIEVQSIQGNYDYQYQEIEKEPQKIYPYERTLLLTKKEWYFYKRLKSIADKYNLHILSKVRMEDVIRVKNGLSYSETQSARGRIKSRHIDFIIAEPEYLKVLIAIELDDRSHQYRKAQEADMFKNEVFRAVGLPYIRTYGNDDIEALICQILNISRK